MINVAQGTRVAVALHSAGLVPSPGAGDRVIAEGGARVDGKLVHDINARLTGVGVHQLQRGRLTVRSVAVVASA